MKMFLPTAVALAWLTACSPAANEAPEAAKTPDREAQYTYVIVHGASGGGWDWKTMDDLLSADGHTVFRPTLTGLGEKTHLNNNRISLTTHIDDIVNLILFEDLHEVVLVGHSYGGMVITGVMNRIPERLKHVVFLDAAAPEDGMSAEDLWGKVSDSHKVIDGIIYFEWLNPDAPIPHDVPQSLLTFTEPVSFNNPEALALPATFIAYLAPDQTTEERSGDPSWQIAESRQWMIMTLESDHNAQRSHPLELKALLEAAPE